MGIKDSFLNNPSGLSLGGITPPTRPGALRTSTMHNQSSINDNPDIEQQPSVLDLDGVTPPKYLDNPPN